MLRIAERSDSVLLGTATPIQTDRGELYDLMRILNAGCHRVLGDFGSPWRSRDDALDMISGRTAIPSTEATCWAWLRDPLIPRGEHRTASRIRDELGVSDNETSARAGAIDTFSPGLRNAIKFDSDDLIRNHNPFVRHTIKLRRADLKALDGTPYFPEIRIVLHGEEDEAALEMPPKMGAAYADARAYCQHLGRTQRSAGLLRTLLLRRVGSSLAAGLSTAERLLNPTIGRNVLAEEEVDVLDAEEIAAATRETDADALLQRAIDNMRGVGSNDPKLLAIIRHLRDDGWRNVE